MKVEGLPGPDRRATLYYYAAVWNDGDTQAPKGSVLLKGGSVQYGDPMPGTTAALSAKAFNFTVMTEAGVLYPFRSIKSENRDIWKTQIQAAARIPEPPTRSFGTATAVREKDVAHQVVAPAVPFVAEKGGEARISPPPPLPAGQEHQQRAPMDPIAEWLQSAGLSHLGPRFAEFGVTTVQDLGTRTLILESDLYLPPLNLPRGGWEAARFMKLQRKVAEVFGTAANPASPLERQRLNLSDLKEKINQVQVQAQERAEAEEAEKALLAVQQAEEREAREREDRARQLAAVREQRDLEEMARLRAVEERASRDPREPRKEHNLVDVVFPVQRCGLSLDVAEDGSLLVAEVASPASDLGVRQGYALVKLSAGGTSVAVRPGIDYGAVLQSIGRPVTLTFRCFADAPASPLQAAAQETFGSSDSDEEAVEGCLEDEGLDSPANKPDVALAMKSSALDPRAAAEAEATWQDVEDLQLELVMLRSEAKDVEERAAGERGASTPDFKAAAAGFARARALYEQASGAAARLGTLAAEEVREVSEAAAACAALGRECAMMHRRGVAAPPMYRCLTRLSKRILLRLWGCWTKFTLVARMLESHGRALAAQSAEATAAVAKERRARLQATLGAVVGLSKARGEKVALVRSFGTWSRALVRSRQGLVGRTCTLAHPIGIELSAALRVTALTPGGQGALLGVRVGWLLAEVGLEPVHDLDSYRELVAKHADAHATRLFLVFSTVLAAVSLASQRAYLKVLVDEGFEVAHLRPGRTKLRILTVTAKDKAEEGYLSWKPAGGVMQKEPPKLRFAALAEVHRYSTGAATAEEVPKHVAAAAVSNCLRLTFEGSDAAVAQKRRGSILSSAPKALASEMGYVLEVALPSLDSARGVQALFQTLADAARAGTDGIKWDEAPASAAQGGES